MPSQPLVQTLQMLTPAMREVVERMAAAKLPALYTLDAAAAKAAYAKTADVLDVPKAKLARVEDFTLVARDGYAIPARLYADSRDGNLPALLYCHGGGFTTGGIFSHDGVCREIARQSGAAVVSIDYRLAPEWRFPAAVHDAWDALETLARNGHRYGIDPARLAIGGDSTGGTLAAASAIHARDIGIVLALQVLIYPSTAAYQDTDSHQRFAEGPVLDKPLIDWFFAQYIDWKDRADWRFAPLNAEDVEGVAPAWIGLAECDPLVDEGVQYADKLRAAGVPVDLEIYRGMIHDFITLGRVIPQARQLHSAVAAALRKAFMG
ncbi:MAG: alpha/beta hydrolase [Burkholderiaceae bacterium]|jgi:acetyl esterase|nr:alpha/beta hydrolase [Burkholderiaceae bacterium]